MKAAKAAPARPAPSRGPDVGRAKAPLSELVSSAPWLSEELVAISVSVDVEESSSVEVEEEDVLVLPVGLGELEKPEEEPTGVDCPEVPVGMTGWEVVGAEVSVGLSAAPSEVVSEDISVEVSMGVSMELSMEVSVSIGVSMEVSIEVSVGVAEVSCEIMLDRVCSKVLIEIRLTSGIEVWAAARAAKASMNIEARIMM